MKTITKEITNKKTVYVSADGKEFETESACREWEKSYKGTISASWKLIHKKEVSDVELGLPWSSDDHECYLLRLDNLDDIALVNAYINCTTGYEGSLTTAHINKYIVLNFGYDHDFCDVYDLDNHLKEITESIEKAKAKFEEAKQ